MQRTKDEAGTTTKFISKHQILSVKFWVKTGGQLIHIEKIYFICFQGLQVSVGEGDIND